MEGVFVSFIFSSHSLRFRAAHLGRFRYKENWERVCEKKCCVDRRNHILRSESLSAFCKVDKTGSTDL